MINKIDDLHPYIESIWMQTKDDPSTVAARNFIGGFFENWVGEFIHVYGDDLLEAAKLDNSLFLCYVSAQSTNFHWYAHSLYCGAYTIIFREFRCILEGLFMVYKIDSQHPLKTVEEKLSILENSENQPGSFGKALFRSSGYADWPKYYAVYQDLSSYIHFSYSRTAAVIQKIKSDGFPDAVDYRYDQQKLMKAYDVWKQMETLAVNMVEALASQNNMKVSFSAQIFD